MKKLERIPKEFTPKLTNGEAILYISETDQEKAVLENQREGILLELPTQSALARGYWSELPQNWKPRTKTMPFESKSTRKWPLKQEPYDPDARDADNDGIIQEGTPWERPAGTRFIRANGREIMAGLVSADRPRAAKLVDANGKEVDYTPTYDRPGYTGLGPTIGETAGNVARSRKGPEPEVRKPEKSGAFKKRLQPRKLKKSIGSETEGVSISEKDFRKLVMDHGKRKLPKNFWNMKVRVFDSVRGERTLDINRRTSAMGNTEEWEEDGRDTKIATAYLIARRMRENGFDLKKIFPNSTLYISPEGTAVLNKETTDDDDLDRMLEFFPVRKDDPLYEELYDEAAVGWIISQWTVSSSMIRETSQRALQNAVADFFDLRTEKYDLSKDRFWSSEDVSETLQGFVQSMYEETQEIFSDADISDVVSYRGFGFSLDGVGREDVFKGKDFESVIARDYVMKESANGKTKDVLINLRSISSFTTDENIAKDFAGEGDGRHEAIVSTSVPVERILACPGSGIGCLSESELVIIGASEGVEDRVDVSYEIDSSRQKLGKDGAISEIDPDDLIRDAYDRDVAWASLSPERRKRIMDLGLDKSELDELLYDLWYDQMVSKQ